MEGRGREENVTACSLSQHSSFTQKYLSHVEKAKARSHRAAAASRKHVAVWEETERACLSKEKKNKRGDIYRRAVLYAK